jgi:transcriptional regulator GlxA family with amidase domain
MRRHEVAVLALDQVTGFDLGTPPQILGTARDETDRQLYRVRVCTPGGLPVRSSAGFTVHADHGLELLAEVDTIIVSGIYRADLVLDGKLDPEIAKALTDAAPTTRIVSICTGAFALAAAGLLDGRRATTHWWYVDAFRRQFPHVELDPDVLFVDEGDILTSAGVGAGIDLCLHLVRKDFGAEVANRAARRCVVPPWRSGGQSQYIERPMPVAETTSTAPAREWALTRLHEPLDLKALADQARMSVRTFTRRFRDETGMSPGKWITQQRVDHARHLLETTDLPVDLVAQHSGFGTGAALRLQMSTAVGVAPSVYRNTFRATG